jgi:hypothetical protein
VHHLFIRFFFVIGAAQKERKNKESIGRKRMNYIEL